MMRGRAWCLLFWLMLCPALAFSHSAALCPALPEDYTGVPPLFEPEPVFTIEALEGESYADSLLAHLNSIHPYHYDKRLGDLVAPWTSPAAALLYPGNGPPRPYNVGDYVGVSLGYNAPLVATPNPSVYQVTWIGSSTATTCFAPAPGRTPYVNGASLTASGTALMWHGYTQSGCTNGYLRYYQVYYNVTGPITVTPSCTDDVWNGDETGIDCGGSCGPCATGGNQVTVEQGDFIINILFAVGLLVVFGLGLLGGMHR